MSDTNKKSIFITDNILIAMGPVFLYLLTFVYEKGFSDVFGIPLEFLSIGISNLFVYVAALSKVFIVVILTMFIISILPFEEGSIYLRKIMKYIISLILLIGYILILGFERSLWSAVLFSVFILIEFVSPIFDKKLKKFKTYKEKLIASEINEPTENTPLARFLRRIGFQGWLILVIIYLGLTLSYTAGKTAAENKDIFMVLNTPNQLAVVKVVGENMICIPFDQKKKTFKKQYFFVKIKGDTSQSINYEKIGPLVAEATDI